MKGSPVTDVWTRAGGSQTSRTERMTEMRACMTHALGDEQSVLSALAAVPGLTLEKLADPDAVPDRALHALLSSVAPGISEPLATGS